MISIPDYLEGNSFTMPDAMKRSLLFSTGLFTATLIFQAGCSKPEEPTGAEAPSAPSAATQVSAPVQPMVAVKIEKPMESYSLKSNWKQGTRYVREVQYVGETDATTGQGVMDWKLQLGVVPLPSETAGQNLEVEILGHAIQSKMGDQVLMDFDSSRDLKTDKDHPGAKDLRKAVGGKVQLLTDRNGDVERVQGHDVFIRRLQRGTPRQYQGLMMGMFSEDNFHHLEVSRAILPPREVGEDSKWEHESPYPAAGMPPLKLHAKYTLAGVEEREGRKLARIESTGVIQEIPSSTTSTNAAPDKAGTAQPAQTVAAPAAKSRRNPTPSEPDPDGRGGADYEKAMAASMQMEEEIVEFVPDMKEEPGMGQPAEKPEEPAKPARPPGEIGTVKATYWFDMNEGQVFESDVQQDLDLTLNLGNQTITRSMKIQVRTKLKAVEPAPAAP